MKQTWKILIGYLIYSIFGTVVFMLPISQVSGSGLSFTDALFVAVSGISTTGLSPILLEEMTFFGQFVLMTLIFLGGIGYMTFSAFISLSVRGAMSTEQDNVLRHTFVLPKEIHLRQFVTNIGIYALVVQVIGAIVLYFIFQDDPRANPVWSAIFHSVSTFATAGFSLYPDNFESYVNHGPLNLAISTIAILGALGFIVATDIVSVIRGQRKGITLTTRVILGLMGGFLTVSTLLMMFFSGISQGNGIYQDFLIASFQNINAMTTAGYNSVPMADISGSFLFMLMILMIIGGAPSGTAGGMKITTVSAVFAAVRAFIFGDKQITLLNRAIPMERVRVAIATAVLYLTMLAIGCLLVLIAEPDLGVSELLFESVSALGTVGLSAGITSELGEAGKLIIILLMYMGRVGVLTIMTTVLVQHHKHVQSRYEDVAV